MSAEELQVLKEVLEAAGDDAKVIFLIMNLKPVVITILGWTGAIVFFGMLGMIIKKSIAAGAASARVLKELDLSLFDNYSSSIETALNFIKEAKKR